MSYAVRDQYSYKIRRLRVVCIGAGLTGIAAVYKLQTKHSDLEIDFQIYEKNHDVGGTWLENRYPGCACDVPAHSYTYSWEGNAGWSRFYAERDEIFAYYKGLADKWGVADHTRYNAKLVSATWDPKLHRYDLEVEDVQTGEKLTDYAEVLINATGWLNTWKWPDIPGLQSFKGRLFHTANWQDEYDYKDKRVAVIGNGSSAIQVVPRLQPHVSKLISFNRSPTWITSEFGEDMAPHADGRDAFYPEAEKHRMRDPEYLLKYRKWLEDAMNTTYLLFRKDAVEQKEAVKAFSVMMANRLKNDERLCRTLIPSFGVGCRRFTPGHGYLEALVADNAEVVTEEIDEIVDNGLKAQDGKFYEVDAIVCATGFNTSFRPNFRLIGRHRTDLGDVWEVEPKSYISIAASGFPNYFIMSGPNAPIGNGPVIPALEKALDYAFAVVRKIQREDIAFIDPKQEAVDEFIEHKDAYMQDMVWTDRCRSWYKNGTIDGPVSGPWCGSTLHFLEVIGSPRYEDFDIVYRTKNRWTFLGNGKSEVEGRKSDMSWYLTPGKHPFRKDIF